MKKLFNFRLLVLIGVLIMSINTGWGQTFSTAQQPNVQIQSQPIMNGGAYTGTVYEPFSGTTPSEQSYSPAKAPGGPRRGYDANGNWTPDAEDLEYAGDTTPSDQSPIGEPWVLALFALAFAGVIAIRQYKSKTIKSMNMKKSTKFIAALALLFIVGTGNMRAYEQLYLVGDPCGGSWDTKTYAMPEKGETGQRVIYIYMTANDRFRFMIHHTWDGGNTWYDKPVGETTMKSMDGIDSEKDCRLYMWSDGTPEAAKFTGNTGIISVNTYQKDQEANPWVALRRPTIQIRHNWGHASGDNAGWDDIDMTDNNDGTYTWTGNYGYNLTYVGSRDYDSNDNGSNFFKKFENIATVYGSPSAGDACLFKYDANGYASIGSSTSYRGTLYIRKLSSITYNGNGNGSGTAPSTQSNLPAGVAVNLAGAGTLSRSNYTLSGWNTAADGSGTHYNLGASITPNGSNLTLYAEWKQEVDLLKGTNGTADGSSDVAIYLNATSLASHTNATRTGYDLTGYWTAASGGTQIVNANGSTFVKNVSGYTDSDGKWNRTGSISDLTAQWTAHVYTMTLKPGLNGTGSDGSLTVAYDATAKSTMSYSFTNTGYHIIGWYPSQESDLKVLDTDGTFAANNVSGYITSGKWSKTSDGDLHAHWAANTFTIKFDKNGGSGDAMVDQDFTYNSTEALTTNTYYKDGYSFDGWALTSDGSVAYADGADGCTITTMNEATVTLYAHWTPVSITGLSFDPSSAGGDTDVEVTPVFSGVPTGTVYVCWGLYRDMSCTEEIEGVFAESPTGTGAATFTTPSASGVYYVKAHLQVGSSTCGSGTSLGNYSTSYVVASDHTVTVRHMCGSTVIHAPTEVVVPAGGTEDVSPLSGDDVFGYEFDSWTLGDGVSSDDDSANPITISAYYNGTLTANYTKKSLIYFKNTLEWDTVYLNMYSSTKWNTKGAGNSGDNDGENSTANVTLQNQGMYRVPGTSDVFYFDYGAAIITPTAYVSFTDRSQNNYDYFSDDISNPVKVCYPTKPDANGSENTDYGFVASLPMFVPLAGQTPQGWNNPDSKGDRAQYNNKGYWRLYEPATGRTGYKLKIYSKPNHKDGESDYRRLEYELDMTESATTYGFVEATIELEGNHLYGIKVVRDDGRLLTNTTNSDLGLYESSSYTTLSKDDGKSGDPSNYRGAALQSTTAGDYTFMLACDASNFKIGVKKPAANGDYRIVYRDADHNTLRTQRYSRTITKLGNAEDIVSFFIDKGNSEGMRIEYISGIAGGAVTWARYDTIQLSGYSTDITADGVYNFYLSQNGEGAIHVDSVRPYTGEFYIRTDAVGGTKWADYRNTAHKMAYSEYSKDNAGYTHYWMKHLDATVVNVKFVVANDYSAWVSDTVIKQDPEVAHIDANGNNSQPVSIRFSYDQRTNEAKRTYLANSTSPNFLVLKNNATASSGNVKVGGVDKSGVDVKFNDRENYIYDIEVQVVPSADVRVKVYANYNVTDQNLIGDITTDSYDGANAQQLLSGSGNELQTIRVLYDFKTNRMVSAWEPAGTIEGHLDIDADLMIVREHQNAAQNIVLADLTVEDKTTPGKVTTDKRIYGVMRFNRWILNNLSDPTDKDPEHAEEDPDDPDYYGNHHTALSPAAQLPTYQRNLYYISFPFDVKVSEIFGFGTYGTHYAIQRYDGAGRAQNGYWIDSDPNWKWVAPNGKLNAYEGYVLSLSLSNMAANKFDVWANRTSEVELYFPSTTVGATIDTESDVVIPALNPEDYACTIERDSRNVKDSYWRCIGVPCYANYNDNLYDNAGEVINWQKDDQSLPFIYDISWNDKSLIAYEGSTFAFKAMHSYLVQYGGEIHWKNVVAEQPKSIVARQRAENEKDYTYRLELRQGEEFCDQAFVRMSDKEGVTTDFDFDQDMWKQKYGSRSNIYTLIGTVEVAGNSMPISNQITYVPVGVTIVLDGDYTFAIPDGTNGVGATLIDNETGVRTNLALMDYTINLTAGTYENRFYLELSPIAEVPTGIGETDVDASSVRKVVVDGTLYIVKDGQVYDARGCRLE